MKAYSKLELNQQLPLTTRNIVKLHYKECTVIFCENFQACILSCPCCVFVLICKSNKKNVLKQRWDGARLALPSTFQHQSAHVFNISWMFSPIVIFCIQLDRAASYIPTVWGRTFDVNFWLFECESICIRDVLSLCSSPGWFFHWRAWFFISVVPRQKFYSQLEFISNTHFFFLFPFRDQFISNSTTQ